MEVSFQFLDVGMGDSTLLQIRPGGQGYDTLMLVDFGEKGSQFKTSWNDALAYLTRTISDNSKTRGSPTPYLDYLILTHPDGDHYNKVEELIKAKYNNYPGAKLRIGEVYYSGENSEYGSLIDTIKNYANTIYEFGDKYHSHIANNNVIPDFRFGGIKIYILSANFPKRNAKNTNPKSIVLMVEVGKHKMILQGDAEAPTEKAILKYFGGIPGFLDDVYALKLGHHGSKKGTSLEWIKKLKPKAIFASGDFVWAHPYCDPICRVVNNSKLTDVKQYIWYCCGNAGKYYNNRTRKAICMNLFYWVKGPAIEDLIHEDVDTGKKKKFKAGQGETFGVQWELAFVENDDPLIFVTDLTYPANPSAIPPGWDCSKNGPAQARAFVPAEALRRRALADVIPQPAPATSRGD